MASHPNGPPPLFAPGSGQMNTGITSGRSSVGAVLNLDDIFGDVMFTPDGDTVFLSEQPKDEMLKSGEGGQIATMASKPDENGNFRPTAAAGGLYTTQLHEGDKPALTMGAAAPDVQKVAPVPFKNAPQAGHHLQYAAPKKKRTAAEKSADRKMSEQQKVERRYVHLWSSVTMTAKLKLYFHSQHFLMDSFVLLSTASVIVNTQNDRVSVKSFYWNRCSSPLHSSRKRMISFVDRFVLI